MRGDLGQMTVGVLFLACALSALMWLLIWIAVGGAA